MPERYSYHPWNATRVKPNDANHGLVNPEQYIYTTPGRGVRYR